MKTKDFIKILQEEDPSGEAHIRMNGGVPCYAECKHGYYDGVYDYINEDEKWVHTIENYKIDIICKEPCDIIYELADDWNPFKESEEGLWEKCKNQFIVELNDYADPIQRQEKINIFFKNIRETYEHIVLFLDTPKNKFIGFLGWISIENHVAHY